MEYIEKCFSELADLETFDPKVFLPNENVSKDICGFVLTLALIYSDIKNLIMFYETILKTRPHGEFKFQKDWGEYNGLIHFLDRLNISALHELFNLIKREQNVLKDKFMISLIRSMNEEARIAWQAIADVSLDNAGQDSFSKDLMFIRNKITFHYDSKIVLKGFWYFFEQRKVTDKAFISRGNKMVESRFYFADAAAESYLLSLSKYDNLDSFFEQLRKMIDKINLSIWYIIIGFIQKRGGAFRKYQSLN